ncbi:MAG: carbamoyltransferase [Actinomycetota bacterium]|nr:carbamoyltransferase [Actinomycetota bacterium]
MTSILGISALYHDAAAAMVIDGEIVAAAQEERFTRKKHDERVPREAIAYCLSESGLMASELDFVAFYEKPMLKFERLLHSYVAYAPLGARSFLKAMPLWLRHKLHIPRELNEALERGYAKRFVFTEHHESHAASAFYPSPFDEAAIMTFDGVGEWATATLGVGRGNAIELDRELRFPHSLGLLYSAFTYFCGFRVNSGEYKLMGLAPYGEPTYADQIRDHLIDLKDDGSFRLDMRYFRYARGLTMTTPAFDRLFGGPARSPEGELTQREMDLAASIQVVTEEVILRTARHLHDRTRLPHLCMAGGVALNCVANSRLLVEGPFERIWVQPAAGDAGGALGAALLVWHQLLGNERIPDPEDSMRGAFLGPAFSDDDAASVLRSAGATYTTLSDDALLDAVARLLVDGKVVGWFQGRMEFGPRALGARSIIGDARNESMQSVMNLKIKFRESFRPFAPAVLAEEARGWFDVIGQDDSPYMLFVADVAEERRRDEAATDLRGLEKLRVIRSDIPAVTHVDHSARIQTVDASRHGRFRLLMDRFHDLTGCPVIVNTSFNVRGEPIVHTPHDAYRCFLATDMDALVIGNHLLLKPEQGPARDFARDEHLKQFQPD